MFSFKKSNGRWENGGRKIRAAALILALVMLVCLAASCSPSGAKGVDTPVLECKKDGISLSFYEFLLSRMKGAMALSGYDVKSSAFWSEIVDGTDVTYEQYFNSSVLESCKKYLCALAIFKEEGLTLPASAIAAIEEEIEFYISLGYVGGGSVDKLNTLIAAYGVDAESLKQAYEIEAKYEYLLSYLYGSDASLIADNVKEDHYRENYYRFKQVLIPNFYYVYELDEHGNEIYFDVESGERLYDTENGSFVYDEKGNRIKDEDGNTIYFDEDGNVLYDKVNGKRHVVLDDSGEAVQHFYTEAEMQERALLSREIFEAVKSADSSLFEEKMSEYNENYGADESYPDGYYLSDIESAGYNEYMLEMLEALKTLGVGECAIIESEYGYHIIRKYELDEGKYADGAYAEWFEGFSESLITKLFEAKCQSVYQSITVNEENLKKARSIRNIGTNTDY